ncbi:hypothetical protein [Halomonas sp. BC04]|uniref:hypothetical protein n=1 Tax=Halomonas sp. BC04 TaxID=1403540 RepID=UPI0003ED7A27|nr:hypothetical protein [Halomonas sp. BC04]EWH00783.1 hypothetical protein Q427_17640 [Halomonas sp. BC04]
MMEKIGLVMVWQRTDPDHRQKLLWPNSDFRRLHGEAPAWIPAIHRKIFMKKLQFEDRTDEEPQTK